MENVWTLNLGIPVWMIAAILLTAVVGAIIMGLRKEWLDDQQGLLNLVIVAITAVAGFAAIQQLDEGNRLAWRANIEERAGKLLEKSLESNSMLPCLIPTDYEGIASTCAKLVYSSAPNMQQASVFTGELIELLQEAEYYRDTKQENYDPAFMYWKAYLEEDPYGITSWVILRDYGCTEDKLDACEVLTWFKDPSVIKKNIADDVVGANIAKYLKVDDAPLSATPAATTPASTTPPAAAPPAAPPAPPPAPAPETRPASDDAAAAEEPSDEDTSE